MKFTQEIVNKITQTDTLTKKQFEVIGETWPPKTGWKKRNFGKNITEYEYQLLLLYRKKQHIKKSMNGYTKITVGSDYKETNNETTPWD